MFTSALVQRRGQHEAKDSSRTKGHYVVTKMARAVHGTSSHLCTRYSIQSSTPISTPNFQMANDEHVELSV
jgi:hypothetical protein